MHQDLIELHGKSCWCIQKVSLPGYTVGNTLLDDKAKGKNISVEMHKIYVKLTKTGVNRGYQGRPMKYVHFTHFNEIRTFRLEVHDGKTLTRSANFLVFLSAGPR